MFACSNNGIGIIVIRFLKLVLFCFLCAYYQQPAALACRYNVRQTGFVDLGIESYYFYGYVKNDTPADVVLCFEQVLKEKFADSNIRTEIINIEQQKEHPAIKNLESLQIKSFPAAVLVSPDGQMLAFGLTEPARAFKDTLEAAVDSILFSPKREEIVQQAIEAYSVVLLIEAADTAENQKAKAIAYAAIKSIEAQMDTLPKPIAPPEADLSNAASGRPPVLVVVDYKSLDQEKVLLWSLGLNAHQIFGPHIAVIYGKARWIGPMFNGEKITEDNLTRVLYIIGEDCECGLDQRWVQGTMLPVRWDRKLQEKVAANLGFDPESPMIKMEIGSIVGRGMGGSSYPGVPFGYQPRPVGAQPVGARSKPEADNTSDKDIYSPLRAMALVTIGLMVVVVIIGIVALLRPKKI
jgi:hypothetical protein